jgi:tRNA threonylcarbamoyl adenosine modification protein YeaZ
MPMVDASLFHAGCTLAEMDAVAVVTGPGSFTGVRIGVATARGLAHGSGKPCIGVNALEALSLSAGSFDGVICPIQDARAGQVYGAAFMRGDRLLPDAPMKLEDFLAAAEKAAAAKAAEEKAAAAEFASEERVKAEMEAAEKAAAAEIAAEKAAAAKAEADAAKRAAMGMSHEMPGENVLDPDAPDLRTFAESEADDLINKYKDPQ